MRVDRYLRRRRGDKTRSRDRLLQLFPQDSIGAEIGVWKGDFSARMLTHVRPRELNLIDPWAYLDEPTYKNAQYGGGAARSQADMDDIHRDVAGRFATEISRGIVHIQRLTSHEAAGLFPDAHFDWIYIDANHLYEYVLADLRMYYPKVKPDGFVAGDDYGKEGWWGNGVKQAVDEFVAAGNDKLQLMGSQFIIHKS